jgi:hypothetical protein
MTDDDGLAAVMAAIVEFGEFYAASSVRQLHVETAEVERQVRLYRQRGIVEALEVAGCHSPYVALEGEPHAVKRGDYWYQDCEYLAYPFKCSRCELFIEAKAALAALEAE